MRFARNLHRVQVPEWAAFYVDYLGLSTSLKGESCLQDVRRDLERERARVGDFLASQKAQIERRLSCIEDTWGIRLHEADGKLLQGVSQVELIDLQASLTAVSDHIIQLESYLRVNHEAISRMLDKMAAISRNPSEGQGGSSSGLSTPWMTRGSLETPCSSLLRVVNEALRASKAAINPDGDPKGGPKGDPERDVATRSLLHAAGPHHDRTSLLLARDSLGRTPLHCAAEAGLHGVCEEILISVPTEETTKSILEENDAAGYSPLHYAIRKGHAPVVRLMLDTLKRANLVSESCNSMVDLLALAISSRLPAIALDLIAGKWGIGFVGRTGKTALHLATEEGLEEVAEALLSAESIDSIDSIDVNAAEKSGGRTSLALACIHGHLPLVQLLLHHHADPDLPDLRGWLPKDHAAYRGYLTICNALPSTASHRLTIQSTKRTSTSCVLPRRSKGESVLFIHLGTFDLFKKITDIDLSPFRQKRWPAQTPDTSLLLEISLEGDPGQTRSISLPVIADQADFPWCFTTSSPETAMVVFKIYSALEDRPVGTAVGLLASLKGGLGPKRESLVRDYTIPLIGPEHDYVGAITFTFVVARPLKTDFKPPARPQELVQEKLTALAGHRGNGQNDNHRNRLQLGENTLQSFQAAVNHGASIVEFDVQITKDDVPVMYHDFLVTEKGMDATMHTMTYSQFMAISEVQTGGSPAHQAQKQRSINGDDKPASVSKRRLSLDPCHDVSAQTLVSQMERTWKYPGFKCNVRGQNIHESFITLERMLRSLPEHVIFDMEIKYPMLSEAADYEMDPFVPELNHILDVVLSMTFQHAGPRQRIILSSFNPEVCMVLAVKQHTYPIMFLNDSSNHRTGDVRATSTQTAIRFARSLHLDGVGMAAEPFVASPGLIGVARGQGLYTLSYGDLNDDVENVKMQSRAGLDAVLVNKVRLIRQALDEIGAERGRT